MDEQFTEIKADIKFMKERLDLCVSSIDKNERRWELNDRRFNRQMELLENHQRRITTLERKPYL